MSDSITASDLSFTYAGGFGLSLDAWRVPTGGSVALHGPSGCGKSTLLNLIAGVLPATSGSLRVEGRELVGLAEPDRRAFRIRTVGFVFQDHPLVDYLSALDNVLLPYRLHPALSLDRSARERAADLLDRLGLSRHASTRPSALSMGEQQRVALARALVTAPRLVLADEPTSGLDPANTQRVVDLLLELTADTTLVVVTHDPTVIARFPATLDVGALGAQP